MHQQSEFEKKPAIEQKFDCKSHLTKPNIFRALIVACALICLVMVIFILAKSSAFFSLLFQSDTELTAKAYLDMHYKSFMTTLYIFIIGFVVVLADTLILFYKFSQKDKMLWFHLAYLLTLLVSGIVTLTDTTYEQHMFNLSQQSLLSVSCTSLTYLFECILSPFYLEYVQNMMVTVIIFLVFFSVYIALYHYTVVKLIAFNEGENHCRQGLKDQDINKSYSKNDIIQLQHKNESFMSQIYDQDIN